MFKKLLAAIEGRDDQPIEIEGIAAELVNLGCQDEFIFSPQNTDPGVLRGIYYQYIKHNQAYGQPILVTLIVYSQNVSLEWQRMISCKELIHVCDSAAAKTDTRAEVDSLLEKLLGPLSTEDYGLADFQTSVDRLALYQALGLLFPLGARAQALKQIKDGNATVDEIVTWAVVPKPLILMALTDEWPGVFEALADI